MKKLIRANVVWLFGCAQGSIFVITGEGLIKPFHWATLFDSLSRFILLLIVGVAGYAKNRATSLNYLLANATFFVGGF